jgi:hypothetical protein
MNILSKVKDIVIGAEKPLPPVLGRNDRCWCDSGKKYKNCHLEADERKRAASRSGPAKAGGGLGI